MTKWQALVQTLIYWGIGALIFAVLTLLKMYPDVMAPIFLTLVVVFGMYMTYSTIYNESNWDGNDR